MIAHAFLIHKNEIGIEPSREDVLHAPYIIVKEWVWGLDFSLSLSSLVWKNNTRLV